MKTLLRNSIMYAFVLSLLPAIFSGVVIKDGLATYLVGGFVLSLLFLLVRPVLQLITLPLHIITFGMFAFIINMIIIYLLTVFLPQISIKAFTYPGVSFLGFVVPKIAFNTFFAYLIVAVTFSVIVNMIQWLIKK